MNDRDLADAYQRGLSTGDPGGCPDPEALRAVIEGRTNEAERLELVNHVMACESCRHEFDLLDALHQAGSSPKPARAVPRWSIPLAAAAVGLLIGVTLWSPWSEPQTPVFRGDGSEVQLVTLDVGFSPGMVRLVWRPVPNAVQYELRISARDGSLVTTSQSADTTATFEGDWTAEPGEYQWRVAARRTDGTSVSSPVGSFRIE